MPFQLESSYKPRGDQGQAIAGEMAKLDEFLLQGRAGLHPQLAHFLENRSYAKALMFLGGETDIPVGACGGKAKRSEGLQ